VSVEREREERFEINREQVEKKLHAPEIAAAKDRES
jgi:hypothetical protein